MTTYAELQVTTNFSFLRGASSPDELVLTAKLLGLSAIAVTDRNSLAGIVRGHAAAKQVGIRFVVGARLDFTDAPGVLCFPTDRAAYGRLCRMLTDGKLRTEKGQCSLKLDDLFKYGEGQRVVALPADKLDQSFAEHLRRLRRHFGRSLALALHHLYGGDDAKQIRRLANIGATVGVKLVATNDIHAHTAERRPLQDVLTCIREGCTIHEAGSRLHANAERHLKSPEEMVRLFRRYPEAIARTMDIVEECSFSLDELRYEYPVEPVPEGRTPQEELIRLTWAEAAGRYPGGVPDKVRTLLESEFKLIEQKSYAPYFLTVYDIVRFARSQEPPILCQGRGSAANSAVCYCLGITSINPDEMDVLFERFVSAERNEPPDIDVDFEHERREEVIQYIYEKYGRDRAGIAATVITYRPKSAIRDVGKALGLSLDTVGALSNTLWGWGREGIQDGYIREAGLDPNEPTLRKALTLASELIGFPRHLSQHTGGFVITKGPLCEAVPIENAAMEDRTVIEWDKEDLERAGMLKIDVLALGMLTCLRKGFDLIRHHHGRKLQLGMIPHDENVFGMMSRADTIGVFQIESRAQMSMLPRLQPKKFYDLVIEVAIVRPGPIQGDMVHPYLRRREGKEPVSYPSQELHDVLERTLGVPLFQEQAMKIAIVGAGFTPGEADRLRRAMATFKHDGNVSVFRDRFIDGMVERNYDRDFAERCFSQIEGFGTYGFPESHAASFALLVYDSAWMKYHYPEVFACALLNSQPMGFYQPAQIVRCARDHGVEVRPVDVNRSGYDCTLEPSEGERLALRLGLRQVKGLGKKDADRIAAARAAGYADPADLQRRTGLGNTVLAILAEADAFGSMGLDRRQALWAVKRLDGPPLPLFAAAETKDAEPQVLMPAACIGEEVSVDYDMLSLSLKQHPLALLRDQLERDGITPNRILAGLRSGTRVRVSGLVLIRQQPGTASGVIFMTLEDETGIANIVVWNRMFQRYRRIVLGAGLVEVHGTIQNESNVVHVVAERFVDLSGRLRALRSPPLGQTQGRADAITHPAYERSALPIKSRDFH